MSFEFSRPKVAQIRFRYYMGYSFICTNPTHRIAHNNDLCYIGRGALAGMRNISRSPQ